MFRKHLLDNGVKVLIEKVPRVATTVIGFWIEAGSRFETDEEAGYSHFLEHMLFKGTRRRSASELARLMDRIGAASNASTGQENTEVHIHCLADHLDLAVDILADLVSSPLLDPRQIRREKDVVLEEIRMNEDLPEVLLGDLFFRTYWPDHPIGRPVVGDTASVRAIRRPRLLAFFERLYRRPTLVVSLAGSVPSDRFLRRLERLRLPADPSPLPGSEPPPPGRHDQAHADKETQQVHFLLGFPAVGYGHPLYIPLLVLNLILGGSVSSRLFQEVRDRHGLCYTILSTPVPFLDTGVLHIYGATEPSRFRRTVDLVLQVCRRLRSHPPTRREIRDAKEQIRCQLALSFENLPFLMRRMVIEERLFGRPFTLEQSFDLIRKIDAEDLRRVIDLLFDDDLSHHLVTVGPPGHAHAVQKSGITALETHQPRRVNRKRSASNTP